VSDGDHPHKHGPYDPRDIADALTHVCPDEECGCAVRLAIDTLRTYHPIPHGPHVSPAEEGWGVFCLACSLAEGEYVYPCRNKDDFRWPPAWLIEPPA
jgi:hypothetical protein